MTELQLPPITSTPDVAVHRYEIWALQGDDDPQPMLIGWSNDPAAFSGAVAKHPSWQQRLVRDRHEQAPDTCQCPECRAGGTTKP